ncbi:hypothetical protein F511_21930 [Dorcoceras hygrometricum]|uniref:Retrotransposon gag domain-containing protein n=1 Tax=Dorcoceras hygrometricum TaxID=472368 RepID=A0A2Z7CBC8_9LAMI|nr:hypothetical protein F511_21930 [Dorcoceras hygrometricum]
MNPQTFNGDEPSSDVEFWLQHITGFFDRVRYDDERRMSLSTFQLRRSVERWWRGASRTLEETGVGISWSSFCTAFRQEYFPESFVNAREREFDNLVHGSMSMGEYARRFSSLLAYVPHVAGREKAKRNNFMEGLNEELYSFVLAGSPASYAEAVARAIDIEEGLQNRRSRVRPQGVQRSHPVVPRVKPSQSVQSSQPPQQQVAQKPGHQRFRPRGRQFKKKSGSSSSGLGSSSSGSSSKVEYCGQCGGKHHTAQWVVNLRRSPVRVLLAWVVRAVAVAPRSSIAVSVEESIIQRSV